ncbi:Esterase SGNH hydrolase-type subgroup [Penicillium fimorum]|uniref:Esterase SGNH hydrolase-type subgroup n=1 Tax=Penicillium fimorum TaxID=1882269 RepID=A0A9W9Y635_9EURO|nr:Esterase SGNH hydrolase-type subgroup [Penicillium fimorum]
MPLGGSVTYGSKSNDGNGYRKILREILLSDGHIVGMVGSRKASSMENNDNGGWRGFRIDQVAKYSDDYFAIGDPSWDQEVSVPRMSDMLEYLWSSSRSTVVLSTLLPNLDGNIEPRVLCINE